MKRQPRGRARRTLVGVAVALGSLYAAYVITANVVLMTSIGPSLLSSERVHIAWRRGYSLVPSLVRLRGVAIDLSNAPAPGGWRVEAPRVDARFAPLDLVLGRLVVRAADASGVTIASAHALPPPSVASTSTNDVALALVRPSMYRERDSERNEPVGEGCERGRESLRFERLAAEVREVRVDDLLYRGGAKVAAAFAACAGIITVDDARLDLSSGEVLRNRSSVLEQMHGRGSLIGSSLGRDEADSAILSSATKVALDLDAVVPDVRLPPRDRDAARAEPSALQVRLQFVRGVLAPGSTASIRVGADGGASPSADAALAVDDDGRATAVISAREFGWPPSGGKAPIVAARNVAGRFYASQIALVDPTRHASGSMEASGLSLDLGALPAIGPLVRQGAPTDGEAHFEVEQGIVTGSLTIRTKAAKLEVGSAGLSGELHLAVDVERWPLGGDEAELSVSATLREGREPAATMRLHHAVLRHDDALALRGPVAVWLPGSSSALRALVGGSLPPLVESLMASAPLAADGTLDADASALIVRDIRGSAGIVSFEGQVMRGAAGGAATRATLLFEAGRLAAGVSIVGGKTTFNFVDARQWFEEALPRAPVVPSR